MKFYLLAALLLAPAAFAQAPVSAVPPDGPGDHSGRSTADAANGPPPAARTPDAGTNAPGSAIPPSSNAPVTGRVLPAPSSRYDSGTAETGNSVQANGIVGSSGGGAIATMQSGHLNNR
jgi:hypothetical protein